MKKRVTVDNHAAVNCGGHIYNAQQLTSHGTVIDKSLGDPVIGASVPVEGKPFMNGTVTGYRR